MLLPRYLRDVLRPNPLFENDAWEQRRRDLALADELRKSGGTDLGIDAREAPPRW